MTRPGVRLRVIAAAFAVAVLGLLARAAQVQLLRGTRYAAMAEAQRTEHVVLPARRGGIYDRNGVPLALTHEAYHVGIAANELCPPRAGSACDRDERTRWIANELSIPARQLQRALQDGYAYLHGPYSSAEVALLRGVRGVHLTSELVRFHPDPDFARAVLGRPGADGRPASGVERVLDSLLAGRDGRAVVLRDREGRRYESPSRLDAFPVPGHDVYLTLDAAVQEIVEQALAQALRQFDAAGGDVVVVNPGTGELLAVASRDEEGRSVASAFTSVFEPGSTAKIFVAAALLVHDLARPTDSVWAEEGAYRLGRRTIRDEHRRGWLTLQEVIEQSSNIGIVKLGQRLSPETQYTMLRDFGLGTPTGVEYPAESRGILKLPAEWSGTTAASLTMGYELAVSPIQLVQAYAAIAHDGVLLRPALVREIRAPDGRVVYRHRPELVRRVVDPAVAAHLRAMLRGVVYSEGTGTTAALATYPVAGKTGTAQRAGPSGYVPGSYTANFAALFPADAPQLVMVVKLDAPRLPSARLTAAPLTRVVLERVLAARSDALDRARLSVAVPAERAAPVVGAGTVPYVLDWPPVREPRSAELRQVPDVVGFSLREAARRLHRAGLQVRVQGWGVVRAMDPAPGTAVAPGALVTVVGRGRVGAP